MATSKKTIERTIENRIYFDHAPDSYYFADDVVNPQDYIKTGGFNPQGIKPWLITNEYGVIGIVYSTEQDALDEMVDADRLDSCLVSAEDYAEAEKDGYADEYASLGNAGEPFDISYIAQHELPNKQYAPIKTHYIAMSGSRGCIPDHCEVYSDLDGAVSGLADIFDLGRTRTARLKTDRTLELKLYDGAEYCEITTCNCSDPAVHSENSIDLDDYLVFKA